MFRRTGNYGNCPNEIMFPFHSSLCEKLLMRSKSVIAADLVDPNHIYGFMVYEKSDDATTMHFIYVKSIFRNMGIATQLLNTLEQTKNKYYTHELSGGKFIRDKWSGVYHPYLAFL